jgi:hypothetical protein
MMVSKKRVGLVGSVLSLVLVLAGCGGGAASRPTDTAPKGGFQGAPAPVAAEAAAEPQSGVANVAPSAASEAPAPRGESRGAPAKSSREASADRAPETRPGLGTEWGETRSSRVHDVTFVRDSNRPFASATIHYNDRRGVDALANLHAARDARREVAAGSGAVTITIKDAGGNPLEALRVSDRTLVVGQAGQRYSIVLTNHTGHRFESVVTVDGLDVVNGKPGSLDNRGYVLSPFATVEIEGFRQSSNAVAAFRFASVGESYAAQMGQPRNVGVIGVALFSERGDAFVDREDLRLRDTANPFPADPRFAQPPRR